MTSSGSANPFIGTQAADSMTDAKAVNGNGGVAASTSAGHPSKVRGNTIWDQWMTSTGWFAPLVPPEDPAKLAEKERKAEEQRRIEKERSVHSWRPSQDEASTSTSPVKKGVTRPSLMKRLSSAVELKWWAADAPAPDDNTQVEEEDLQHPSNTTRARRSGSGSLQSGRNRARTGSSSLQPMPEHEDSEEDAKQLQQEQPSPRRTSQDIQMR